VWLFAAKWGITSGVTARRRFGYICIVLGVLLAAMGLASIWAFVGPQYRNAPENPIPAHSAFISSFTQPGIEG
jgi:succinate dehydrogenase / fumarate reductase cytochrome b subunit